MKRRLPTTYQGETERAAISLPPVTADTNRQAPSRPNLLQRLVRGGGRDI